MSEDQSFPRLRMRETEREESRGIWQRTYKSIGLPVALRWQAKLQIESGATALRMSAQ